MKVEVQEKIKKKLQEESLVHWSVNVDAHASFVATSLKRIEGECVEAPRLAKKPYVSEETVKLARDTRKQTRRVKCLARDLRRHTKYVFFLEWKQLSAWRPKEKKEIQKKLDKLSGRGVLSE